MKPITLNFENKEIVMSKSFATRAANIGSCEYRVLVEAKREFPDYVICIKSAPIHRAPSAASRLTYLDMEEYILSNADEDERRVLLEEFDTMKKFGYFNAKKWFMERFPEIKDLGMCEVA